jgi:hypothetical protein
VFSFFSSPCGCSNLHVRWSFADGQSGIYPCPPRVGFFMARHVRPLQSPMSSLSIPHYFPSNPISLSLIHLFAIPRFSCASPAALADGDCRAGIPPAQALRCREIPWQCSSVAGSHGEARLLLQCRGRLPPRRCSGRRRLGAGIFLRTGSPPRDPPGRAPPWPAAMVRLGSSSFVAAVDELL